MRAFDEGGNEELKRWEWRLEVARGRELWWRGWWRRREVFIKLRRAFTPDHLRRLVRKIDDHLLGHRKVDEVIQSSRILRRSGGVAIHVLGLLDGCEP